MPDDVLAGLTKRQMEQLRDRLDRELRACAIDEREGAEAYRIITGHTRASIMLCRPCFERLRLPESRAKAGA